MRIGIDIMGGDYAPGSAIQGSILAKKTLSPEVELVFIGNKQLILSYAEKKQLDISSFEIIHTDQVLNMGVNPVKGYARVPDASIFLGPKLLRSGMLDGFCSAGNTGAMLVGAIQIVSSIPGVIRPAISAVLPTPDEIYPIILDVGLNPDARPDVLYQYAVIGSLYSNLVNNVENPRVSLLNLGVEEEKGNLVTRSTFQLMKDTTDFNFTGNIEGNELFISNNVDVIVCDGFVGNIVLKEAEAFYRLINKRQICNGYFEMFNFENFGGTPILGIQSPMVIGHGISNAKAIMNMIRTTTNVVESGLIENINKSLNK